MNPFPFFLLLFLTAAATLPVTATGILTRSLDALLYHLRSNGHTLLANSIATSDLVFDVLSLRTLTLLAPPDSSLFALDMTLPHLAYLSALRLHVIPSSIDLNPSSHSFAASSSRLIPTLHPSRNLQPSFSGDGNLLLDGVIVLFPRIYHSREFSVYRLRGPLPSSPTMRNGTVLLPPRFRIGNPRRYFAPTTPVASPSHPPASQEMLLAPSIPPAGSFPEMLYSPVSARKAGNVPSSEKPSQEMPPSPSIPPAGELLYSPVELSPLSALEAGNVPSSAPASQGTPLSPSFTPAGSFPEFMYSPVSSSFPETGNWRGVGFKAGGEECGPLDMEKMLCSLGSVSDASVHVNSRDDVVETDGRVVDDYSIRRFADYGL